MELPIPSTLIQILWYGLGIVFARGFGKKLDEDIQSSDWYMKQGPFTQGVLKRLLDVAHHWWMGLFLVVYATMPFTVGGYPVNLNAELYWFGWGVFIDDVPDIPLRIQGYFGVPEEDKKLNIYSYLNANSEVK